MHPAMNTAATAINAYLVIVRSQSSGIRGFYYFPIIRQSALAVYRLFQAPSSASLDGDMQ